MPFEPSGWRLSGILPGDAGIIQTVHKIRSLVQWSLSNAPEVRSKAEELTSGLPERDERSEVEAIYHYVLRHFRYVHDPLNVEMVKSPEVIQREINGTGFFNGDCDDATTYLAALLESIGIPVDAAIISKPGSPDSAYCHIYPVAKTRSGDIPLETTVRGVAAGWQAPHGRIAYYPL